MAAAKKQCFLRFCIEPSLHVPSFKVRGLPMTINLALVLYISVVDIPT